MGPQRGEKRRGKGMQRRTGAERIRGKEKTGEDRLCKSGKVKGRRKARRGVKQKG